MGSDGRALFKRSRLLCSSGRLYWSDRVTWSIVSSKVMVMRNELVCVLVMEARWIMADASSVYVFFMALSCCGDSANAVSKFGDSPLKPAKQPRKRGIVIGAHQ